MCAPTVDEVLALIAQYPTGPVLIAADVKATDDEVAQDIASLAQRRQVLDRLLFIGRSIGELDARRQLRQANPASHCASLANAPVELAKLIADEHSDVVYVRYVPGREEVARAHEPDERRFIAGATVAGQEPTSWRLAMEHGVDGLLTDYRFASSRMLREQG